MERYSQEHIVSYVENVCKYFKISAKQLGSLSEEEYSNLVCETANSIFANGRYSGISEYMLEIWGDEEFVVAINDIKTINAMTDGQRVKLKFILAVKEVGYPLFTRKCPNLELAPFCFSNTELSAKNEELRQFVYHSKYQHLASMLLIALKQLYFTHEEFVNTVVQSEISFPICHLDSSQDLEEKELAEKLEEMMVTFIQIDNHLEVGKRLGLTKRGQYLYDIFDSFICNEYYYAQVDAAKALDQWFSDNWNGWEPERAGEQVDEIVDLFDNTAKKYYLRIPDRIHSLNYIIYDMLHYPLTGFNPEPYEDEEWDDDPDFEDED